MSLPLAVCSAKPESVGSGGGAGLLQNRSMTTTKALLRLTPLALGLAVCLPGLAETPQQVQQRLEHYRQLDAEAALRRQKTMELQEQRRRVEYSRRWKRYGDQEIDFLKWRKQKDGSWVTEFKMLPSPRRFDHSLDELVRQGLVTPTERSLIRGSGDVPDAFKRACLSGALSSQECRSGLAIRWGHRDGTSQPVHRPSSDSLVGVNCTSLMVNRKPALQSWGGWVRPAPGSSDEQLVIDRCTTSMP